MNWQMNSGGDFEAVANGHRYRIEEWSGQFWVYRKPLELSAYSELVHRAASLEVAKEWVEWNAKDESA